MKMGATTIIVSGDNIEINGRNYKKPGTGNNITQEGDIVYVSDRSEEHALKVKRERVLLRTCTDGHICIKHSSQNKYKEGKVFSTITWNYAVPIPKSPKTTLSHEELSPKEFNQIIQTTLSRLVKEGLLINK